VFLEVFDARPHREAAIRTRGSVDEVLDCLRRVVAGPSPSAWQQFLAKGYFSNGTLGDREFRVDYRFNNFRNPQTYAVHGTIEDSPQWRLLRLRIKARTPWLGAWSLAGLLAYGAFQVYLGQVSLAASTVIVACAVGLLAFANAFYIPGVAAARISHQIAREVYGSVLENGVWVVPQDVAHG
jgi:hypothetical protein